MIQIWPQRDIFEFSQKNTKTSFFPTPKTRLSTKNYKILMNKFRKNYYYYFFLPFFNAHLYFYYIIFLVNVFDNNINNNNNYYHIIFVTDFSPFFNFFLFTIFFFLFLIQVGDRYVQVTRA